MPPSDDKRLSASGRLVEPGLQQRPQAVDNLSSTCTCSNADVRFQIKKIPGYTGIRYEYCRVPGTRCQVSYLVRDTRYAKGWSSLAHHSVYTTSQGRTYLTYAWYLVYDTDMHDSQCARRLRAGGQADYGRHSPETETWQLDPSPSPQVCLQYAALRPAPSFQEGTSPGRQRRQLRGRRPPRQIWSASLPIRPCCRCRSRWRRTYCRR